MFDLKQYVEDHINGKIRIATTYRRGLINDHVEVYHTISVEDARIEVYHVFARQDYRVGRGPEPLPKTDEGFFQKRLLTEAEKERGWEKVATIKRNLSNLEDALALAKPEAEKRNVVLYVYEPETGTKIEWKPENWIPTHG